MKPKARLDRRTVQQIARFLKDKRAELKKRVWNVMADRFTNGVRRSPDSAAWATETLHEEIQVTLMDRQSRQLTQIDAALERLSRGEYGLCQRCGEFIGLPRLRALPFAQRCTPCQSYMEREARRQAQPVSVVIVPADEEWMGSPGGRELQVTVPAQ